MQIFEPKQTTIKVKDLNDRDFNLEAVLGETFTVTPISTEKKAMAENQQPITYNLIPKAVLSLKCLQELPIIVVLMYQLYKQFVHQEVAEFIPLIMTTITLQPTPAQRTHKDFNKEVFADFVHAQIKALSFLAYVIRIYQEVVSTHSTQMVKGILSLLAGCPPEVAHTRKEMLIAARHILSTELRIKFVPHMEQLFNEVRFCIMEKWAFSEVSAMIFHKFLRRMSSWARAGRCTSRCGRSPTPPSPTWCITFGSICRTRTSRGQYRQE